jgi:hypothetical protein
VTAPPRQASATEASPSGMRREIFGLDEGEVVLTFPENLSAESYQDLADHLELFLRKAKRRIAAERRSLDYDPMETE